MPLIPIDTSTVQQQQTNSNGTQPLLQVDTSGTATPYYPGERFSANPSQVIKKNPSVQSSQSTPLSLNSQVNGQNVGAGISSANSNISYPDDDPNSWNTIFISSSDSSQPDTSFFFGGRVIVDVHKEMKIDSTLRRPGQDGQPIISKGIENADITLTFKCWLTDHFACYYAMAPVLKPNPSALGVALRRNAWYMRHPVLQSFGITKVVITKMSALKHDDGNLGMWEFTITGKEWISLASSTGSSVSHRAQLNSSSNGSSPTAISPNPGSNPSSVGSP